MGSRVRLAEAAEMDLSRQYRWYLEQAGVAVAERFLQAFDQVVARLAEHPQLGRPRRFKAAELAGIRSYSVGGKFSVHLVFYRFTPGMLSIERVMHGARDLPRRLVEPPNK